MQVCKYFDMADVTAIAGRLLAAMQEKGWTRADLVRQAGLKSPSTITEMCKGSRSQSPQWPKIAAALGVEILWLQYGTGPRHKSLLSLDEDQKLILRAFNLCTGESREEWLDIARRKIERLEGFKANAA